MKVLSAALLLVVGAVTGVAALALHQRWWGLALAVAAVAATAAALPPGWWSRLAFVGGWEVPVVGAGLFRGPGGDVVVAATAPGYTLLVAALALGVAAVVTLPLRRTSEATGAAAGRSRDGHEDAAPVDRSA